MEERLYLSAKSILIDLVKTKTSPRYHMATCRFSGKLNEPPQSQIETLHHFMNVALPTDNRLGLAWKRIGELFEQQLHDGIEAI